MRDQFTFAFIFLLLSFCFLLSALGILQMIAENSNLTSDYSVNDVSFIRREIIPVINAKFDID
jgi:hypothetical protein